MTQLATTLNKYVQIAPISLDASWTLNIVKALVTPNLSVPLLLGLPFLEHNNFVVDFEAHMCIDKRSNYNLLNPRIIELKRQKPCLKQAIAQTKVFKKVMLEELVSVCKDCLKCGIGVPEVVHPLDITGLIHSRIDQLAALDHLQQLDKKVHAEFHEIFEPIPHHVRLPTDVVAHIKLKDANKTIASRAYACLQKYRDAWQTLIRQHLDAGRIQPSLSLYASPAFIIPKTDKTVLPCWVNDY